MNYFEIITATIILLVVAEMTGMFKYIVRRNDEMQLIDEKKESSLARLYRLISR